MQKYPAWHPEGFERYREIFPDTPDLNLSQDRILNREFITAWNRPEQEIRKELQSISHDVTIVFVRGFLGSFMPGNLKQSVRHMHGLGFDTILVRTNTGGSSIENSVRIRKRIQNRENRRRIVFCGHSRGALECLLALESPDLASMCAAVIMSQTAYGPSAIIDSMLYGKYGESKNNLTALKERFQALALHLIGAGKGGRELASARWKNLTSRVDSIRWPFPVLQCASWSSQPTTWLDSWHERLGQIHPGRAHDGQFYLDDLIWPNLPHVLLPQIDHAQPAVGGFGFHPARYWQTLIHLVLAKPLQCYPGPGFIIINYRVKH